MSKFLLTNADDYGYTEDISAAIVAANQIGFLKSTTVLVNFVSEKAVQVALDTPTLSLGLHLNLTSGDPLTTNWKDKYGSFSRPNRGQPNQFDQALWIAFFERYQTADIFEEYETQLTKFLNLFGKSPTHLDTHHYTSTYRTVFPAFHELAKKHNLPVRQSAIWSYPEDQHPMGNVAQYQSQLEQVNSLRKDGIRTTTMFSLEYLCRYDNYYEVFVRELDKLSDNESIEISFHPGYQEEWRRKDLEVLCDKRLIDLVNGPEIQLIDFTALVPDPSKSSSL